MARKSWASLRITSSKEVRVQRASFAFSGAADDKRRARLNLIRHLLDDPVSEG
jgi:hypothetical protein